jgi:hypothetical protein
MYGINKDRIAPVMHIYPVNKGFVPETLLTQPPIFDTQNFIPGSKVAFYPVVKGFSEAFFLLSK